MKRIPAAVAIAVIILGLAALLPPQRAARAQGEPVSIRPENCIIDTRAPGATDWVVIPPAGDERNSRVPQHHETRITCNYHAQGNNGQVRITSKMRRPPSAAADTTTPDWKAQVWVLDNPGSEARDNEAYDYDITNPEGHPDRGPAVVNGEKTLKVRITGHSLSAYRSKTVYEHEGREYHRQTSPPTTFDALTVTIGSGSNLRNNTLQLVSVDPQWEDAEREFKEFRDEHPAFPGLKTLERMLDDGYTDLSIILLEELQQATEEQPANQSPNWWLIGAIAAGILFVLIAVAVGIVILISNMGGNSGEEEDDDY